jgi:hypothetical protein
MTADREDAIVIRWTGVDATPRRLVFEPRSTGGHQRIEQRWTGDEWLTEGQEIVSRVGLEAPAAVVVDGEATLGD